MPHSFSKEGAYASDLGEGFVRLANLSRGTVWAGIRVCLKVQGSYNLIYAGFGVKGQGFMVKGYCRFLGALGGLCLGDKYAQSLLGYNYLEPPSSV